MGIYTPKSAQVNFLWGKNDVRTAIQQFYTPPPQKKTFIPPKTNFWLRPWPRVSYAAAQAGRLHMMSFLSF